MSYVLISMGVLQTTITIDFKAPTNFVATFNGGTGDVDLSWTDNTSDEDNFRIEVDVDGGGFNFLNSPAANATSYSHVGVIGGSTYTYRIRAEKTAENSAWATSNPETIPF